MMHYATAESIGGDMDLPWCFDRNGGEQFHDTSRNRGSLKGNGICSTIMPRFL